MNCLSGLASDATGSQTQNLTATANFSQFSGVLQADTVLDNSLGPTGLLTGGAVTAATGATTFNVAAGTGVLTFPTSISSRTVTWSSFTAVSILGPGIFNTFVAIDADGNLVLKPDFPFTAEQRRQYIVLANVSHANQVNVDYVLMIPNILYNSDQTVVDLANAIGTINLSGNVFSAAANDRTVQKGSGSFFGIGINADLDVRNPNVKESPAESPCLLYKFARNGGVYDVSTEVDNLKWDDNTGVLNLPDVPPNKFTIQRFWIGGTLCGVSLGQTVYDTMADAQAALLTDPYSSLQSPDLVLVSYLIIRRGTTDLSNTNDAKFIPAGKFGTGGSGGAGGTGNVNGPANAVAAQIATFADTSGKLISASTLRIVNDDILSPTGAAFARVSNTELALHVGTGSVRITEGVTRIVTPLMRLPIQSTEPVFAVAGDMFYDTTRNQLRLYNGDYFASIGSGYITPQMLLGSQNGFVVTASSNVNTYDAYKSFDRTPAETQTSGSYNPPNGWLSGFNTFNNGLASVERTVFGAAPKNQEWIQVQFDKEYYVMSVGLKHRGDTAYRYSPKAFTIVGSTDGTFWFGLRVVTGYTPESEYEYVEYKFTPVPCKYIGISITENNAVNNNADNVGIGEIYIKGYP